MTTSTRFRSRIDFVVGLILTAPLVAVVHAFATHYHDRLGLPLVPLGLFVALVALLLWIVCDTSYEITETELRVRSGPQRLRIPLASLRRVRRSRTLIAAPALALRRLELDYGTGDIAVISPAREDEFLALLQTRVPAVDLSTLAVPARS